MTAESCAELLESIPELDTLFERKTPEDVATLLDAFMGTGVTDPEAVSSETEKFGGSTTTNENEETNAVDAAFAELGAL